MRPTHFAEVLCSNARRSAHIQERSGPGFPLPTLSETTNKSSPSSSKRRAWSRLGHAVAVGGMLLFSAFAPHSIAAAEISLAIAAGGWLTRSIVSRETGLRHTRFDLPIWLFFLWTVVSCFFSEEPRLSIAKIQSTCVVFLFYLTQAIVTRRIAVWLVVVMILSGVAGTTYSLYDLALGRGIVVESISPESPLRPLKIESGDAVWRVGGQRIRSVAEMDQFIRDSPTGTNLSVSVISRGEHLERPGLAVTDAMRRRASPSGITGAQATHRFRASGWTRHYSTYAEILQVLVQLAFGLALANFVNHRFNFRSKLSFVAAAVLALGVALTAMRTVLVAVAFGVCVISFRALSAKARTVSLVGLLILLSVGAFVVSQTRARDALWLGDDSSSLRLQVATNGFRRIAQHPILGHGMDAMQLHWSEWNFPGSDMLHLHSTPLQLAFDRGLPALAFWLWIMWLFWRTAAAGEKSLRDSGETSLYGLWLGATGAVAGFFASSLVNYNFGDGEVALVFWWLMGLVVVLVTGQSIQTQPEGQT